MRRSRAATRRGAAFLALVGSIAVVRGGAASSRPPPRALAAASLDGAGRVGCDDGGPSASPLLRSASPAMASATAAVVACGRGGAVDDDPRRRRDRERYDYDRGEGPPPRRSSPPRRYEREDRDRPLRSGPRPGGDPRGPDRPRPGGDPRGPDRRREGGPRPRGDGDGRYGRRGGDDFSDRSNRNGDFRGDGRGRYDGDDRRGPRNRPPVDADPDDGKGKKWFSFKKDKAKTEAKSEERAAFDPHKNDAPIPPPPPPPPPMDGHASPVQIDPAGTERTPIHYMFPTAEAAAEERRNSDRWLDDEAGAERDDRSGADDDPFLDFEEDFADGDGAINGGRRRRRPSDDEDDRGRASPRRDAVTLYMSTRRGALQVRIGSAVVGAALGGFVGKSLMNDPVTMAAAMSSLLLVTGFLRNDYGELSRALGMAFVLTLKRTRSVRREYPTLPHIKGMIRQGPRKPFPPLEDGTSLWQYEPIYRDDPEFKMTYAALSMALVGSFCGGNVPVLPAWIGGIAGALAFASLTAGANARGDLGRSMGMRVVGLVRLMLAINSELRLLGKSATVGGLMFDKVMIMDRKHRIKDRIVAMCKWGYERVVPEQLKEEMQEERPERRR